MLARDVAVPDDLRNEFKDGIEMVEVGFEDLRDIKFYALQSARPAMELSTNLAVNLDQCRNESLPLQQALASLLHSNDLAKKISENYSQLVYRIGPVIEGIDLGLTKIQNVDAVCKTRSYQFERSAKFQKIASSLLGNCFHS